MAQSLVIDWLNENEQRAYPLRDLNSFPSVPGVDPRKLLLDALLIYYTPLPEPVTLDSIELAGTGVTVRVADQPPFVIPDLSVAQFPLYVRNELGSLLVFGSALADLPQSFAFSGLAFEDTVSLQLNGGWEGVKSIRFNEAGPLFGVLEWEEGLQFKVDIQENRITLGARRNYGEPIDCSSFFGDLVLSDCDDIISFVNGITSAGSPGKLSLVEGNKIRIFDDPENHRLFVGLVFGTDDICKLPPIPPAE